MSFYDWVLSLHILAAFAIAAALVLYTVLVVAGGRAESLERTRLLFRLAPVGGPLTAVGMGLTLLLGIVLFFLMRPGIARFPLGHLTWFPEAISPPLLRISAMRSST